MIIDNFYVDWARLRPTEANAVLVVDPNRMSPGATSAKGFQSIPQWYAELF